ncbi:MAG TPA: hypothetical protein VHC63_11695 [Acidimicrobiales bacterium]|nr:hypothetical protein [Acidimicrobiales bacterium]
MRRVTLIVAVVGASLLAPANYAGAATPRATNCGRNDRPETGVQGEVPLRDQLDGRALQGYNCGLALVGHVALKGASANMAWAGHCAYVATVGEGVNVVDVSNPQHPKRTAQLHHLTTDVDIETIAAQQVGNRAVLVVGRYGEYAPQPLTAPMDIYDASNCAHPKFLTTFHWPENTHNLTITPDGTRVFSTLPLQEADIHDPRHPRFLGNLENALVGGPLTDGRIQVSSHDVATSPDGNTIYFGGQTPMSTGAMIADVTDYPRRKPRLVMKAAGRAHSVDAATIGNRNYIVHSEESIASVAANGCINQNLNPIAGAAQPWISDVTDPAHPKMRISRLTLAINQPHNCVRELGDGENASVHYHDVDDPQHTTFVMASMWNAGVRIFDVRDPWHPREVAYFNPGMFLRPSDNGALDKAWGHVHYDAASGQLWFATQSGGFWVVELEPQVRAHLGLPARPVLHPSGTIPRPASTRIVLSPALAASSQYYCTLASFSG